LATDVLISCLYLQSEAKEGIGSLSSSAEAAMDPILAKMQSALLSSYCRVQISLQVITQQ
jgi:hypothetical protein